MASAVISVRIGARELAIVKTLMEREERTQADIMRRIIRKADPDAPKAPLKTQRKAKQQAP